ncbi:ADP-producing CoA ligase, feruloyl-CoA synthetase [Paramagnetospirillum caucaseum]|uniref:3-methylmercaptopropionyl-CoA ligase n=1 Tax=Paramagnetospirillum caucaseum TaxID=1244869 RepID=M3AA98_9PROT|nr:AMP-binding protein [Paramagnetospirillum caucaseum]EME69683.1 ADP-producing CoA ligase, feruloyl-CoA synthetase [Paramagnetospirillum caucaseum]
MNLSDWIERWAGFSADKPALRYEGAELSYGGLARHIARISGALSGTLGIRRGERVAWLGLNNAESIALLFACARVGAIFTPLNWRLTPVEHLALMADSQPSLLVVEPEFADAIAAKKVVVTGPRLACTGGPRAGWLDWDAMVEAAPLLGGGEGRYDDPVLLCYTSGTTGQPKGAVHTQDGMLWNAVNSTQMHDLTSQDRVLTTLPIFHVGGLNIQTMPALHAGATVTLHRRFDAATTLRTLVDERITLAVLVPTQLDLLLAEPGWNAADLSALRCITTGSTIIPAGLVRTIQARGIPVIQIFGSTETGPVAVFQRVADSGKVGVAGHCAVHCEMRLVDGDGNDVAPGQSGEVLIKGRNIMIGYWRDEAATRAALKDGWFATGDIGHLDGDGFLIIDDRKKEMIISGGENIFPAALEAILTECPDIEEAAVVGRPDERWGEIPVAVVVPRPGARLTEEGVLALFQDKVARYKHPRAVIFTDHLPRTSIGKLVKADIRKLARQTPPASSP